MDVAEIALRVVGAFYAFGGYITIRATAMAGLIDLGIGTLTQSQPDKNAATRSKLLIAISLITGASGVALMLMNILAVPLFIAGALVQGYWIMWARKAFPPQDEAEAKGRRQSLNAAVIYTTVTLGVLWMWEEGRMEGSSEPWPLGTAIVALLVYGSTMRRALRRTQAVDLSQPSTPNQASSRVSQPARIRFEVHPHRLPMVDAEDGRLLSHFELLDADLAGRIEEWHDRYAGFAAQAAPGSETVFPDEATAATHRAEAEEIVELLRDIYGSDGVDGPIYLQIENE